MHSFHCEACRLAISHRYSFKLNNTHMKSPFSLIRYDVWGPAPITVGQNGVAEWKNRYIVKITFD